MKFGMIVMLVMTLGTGAAWAADPDMTRDVNGEVGRMIVMMEERRFSSEAITAAQQVIEAAGREGIPAKPMVEKAFEGMAKRVQEKAVVRAMEQVRARYTEAFGYARSFGFSHKKTAELGHAMAECMSAGLDGRQMKQVVERLRHRIEHERDTDGQELVEQSVMATRSMARMGVSSEMTGDVIGTALEHKYNGRDMRTLRYRFQEQARTRSADMVARDYKEALGRGEGINALGRSSTIERSGQGQGKGHGTQSEGASSGGPGGRSNRGSGGQSGGHGR